MFGRTQNYSAPSYWPGKLVDEGGQGSSNDSYGRTIKVPVDDDVLDLLSRTTQQTLPYGAVSSRTAFSENARRLLGVGIAAGGVMLWKKQWIAGASLVLLGGSMALYPGGA